MKNYIYKIILTGFLFTFPALCAVQGQTANDQVGRSQEKSNNEIDFSNIQIEPGAAQKFYQIGAERNNLIPPFAFKSFGAETVQPGGVTTLTITLYNPNPQIVFPTYQPGFLTGVTMTDNLPDGMTVSPIGTATTDCSGNLTALPNTNLVRLENGFLLPSSSCEILVLVRVIKPGLKVNVTEPVSTAGSPPGRPAVDSLNVSCPMNFTVDNLEDNIFDSEPGDGVCGQNYPGSAGSCTLRAALTEVNSITGCPNNYTIRFQTPGTVRLTQGNLNISAGKIVNINGFGANLTIIDGGGNGSVLANSGVTTISGVKITGGDVVNTVGGTGGGLRNTGVLTVTNSVVTGNAARVGGGIASVGGSLTVVNSTISNNTATDAGGVYAENATTLVRNSTISGNSGANGEGLRNNAADGNSTMTLINSTVSGNTTQNENSAIRSEAAAGFTSTVNLTNTTVTNNSTTDFGQNGALWLRPLGGTHSVTLRNTIVSGNTTGGTAFDVEGELNLSSSFNLIGTGGNLTNGANNNIVGVNNPQLGALANNTGSTQTHALLIGSPAIDKGSAVAGMTTDQRGSPRPVDNPSIPNPSGGNGSDIGAFELNSTITPPSFTSEDNALFHISAPGSFTVSTLGNPTPAISRSGMLPSGLTFVNNGDGTATISGTPAANAGGVYQLIFTASNGVNPNATQNFTLTVAVPISFSNTPAATFLAGTSNSYTITTIGVPTPSVTRTTGGLPTGLNYQDNGNGTATVSGTPAAGSGGIYPLTIVAENGVSADATQNFVLTIEEPPTITSPNTAAFQEGSAGGFQVNAIGFPYPTVSVAGTLPDNIVFNSTTRQFTGTPQAGTLGSYPLVITASNGVAPAFQQNFTLNVCNAASVQVENTNDSGAGSLRQALIDVCPGSTIVFAPNVTGTINVGSVINIDKNVIILGPGADVLTLRGSNNNRILFVNSQTTVNVSGLTLTRGNADFFGGAITNSGNLTLDKVVISESRAVDEGAGIYSVGNLTVINSTIMRNQAQGSGGGIHSEIGTLTLVNSTISGNTAGASGGGIYAGSRVRIYNCTIVGNRADQDTNGNGIGGGFFSNNASTTMQNTAVVFNFLRPTFANPVENETDGSPITDSKFNFVGRQNFSPPQILNQTLASNGGSTPTHSIPENSPLADKGGAVNSINSNLQSLFIFSDQRGIARPSDNQMIPNAPDGNGSDIGAFEFAATTAATVSVSGKVSTGKDYGLAKARVIMTKPDGTEKVLIANAFGFFRFDDVQVGEIYVFRVVARRYSFAPQIVSVNNELTELNFIADE